jgi:hypothetical protein
MDPIQRPTFAREKEGRVQVQLDQQDLIFIKAIDAAEGFREAA